MEDDPGFVLTGHLHGNVGNAQALVGGFLVSQGRAVNLALHIHPQGSGAGGQILLGQVAENALREAQG